MTMVMDVEVAIAVFTTMRVVAIAVFTTMRVIEMTMVMDMTTMMDLGRVIALVFTTKEAGMCGLVSRRNRHKLVTGR